MPEVAGPEGAKVAFIAHCLLNQNAKVIGGAQRPGMWEPVIDLLVDEGWTIRQMPCPELAFGGTRRFWWVKDQADTPRFREHCRRLAGMVAGVMGPSLESGDDVVLVGVDSSPTMGVDFTPTSDTWGGEPNIGVDDSRLIYGRIALAAKGLTMPRRTGIRHWFPGYDPAEERARLLAMLAGGTPE